MSMEPNIRFDEWYEVDGAQHGEVVPADVYSFSDEELAALNAEAAATPGGIEFPEGAAPYFENTRFYRIEKVAKWGAQLHMPGYMDQTNWSLYDSEEEAEQGVLEEWGVCPRCGSEESDDASEGCVFCAPDNVGAYCPMQSCQPDKWRAYVMVDSIAKHAEWHREHLNEACREEDFERFVENPRRGVRTSLGGDSLAVTAQDGRVLEGTCDVCEDCPHEDVKITWEEHPGLASGEVRGECVEEGCHAVFVGRRVGNNEPSGVFVCPTGAA